LLRLVSATGGGAPWRGIVIATSFLTGRRASKDSLVLPKELPHNLRTMNSTCQAFSLEHGNENDLLADTTLRRKFSAK
jgi:hypothetical protein